MLTATPASGSSIAKNFTSGDEPAGIFRHQHFRVRGRHFFPPKKQERAIQLITSHQRSGLLVISLQVLQEYYAAVTRKLGVDSELAQRKVELLAGGLVVRFGESDVIAAIELHRLNRISFWDAMIVHAARLSGAGVLYSESTPEYTLPGAVHICLMREFALPSLA